MPRQKVKTAIIVDRNGSFEIRVRGSKKTIWWLTVSSMDVAIRECATFQRLYKNPCSRDPA